MGVYTDPLLQYILGAHLADQMRQQSYQQQSYQQPLSGAGDVMAAMAPPQTVGPNGTVTYRKRTTGVSPMAPVPIYPNLSTQLLQGAPPDDSGDIPLGKKKKKTRPFTAPDSGSGSTPSIPEAPPAPGYSAPPFPFPTPYPGPSGPPEDVSSTITYGGEVPTGGSGASDEYPDNYDGF